MKEVGIIVVLIVLFFVIRFMAICHRDFFIGHNKIVKKQIKYPFIDPYYLLSKKQRAFVDKDDTHILRDVSELMFRNIRPDKGVVKTIYDYDDFGPELNKSGYFEEDLKTVLNGLTTQDDKIDAILKHVKATVKWNDYYGYSCNEGVKKAYKFIGFNCARIGF